MQTFVSESLTTRRRLVVAQLLYFLGATLRVFSTYWSISFIFAVQLYYTTGVRLPVVSRNHDRQELSALRVQACRTRSRKLRSLDCVARPARGRSSFQQGSGHQLWQVSVSSSDGRKVRGHDQFQPPNAARHPVAS